MPTPSNDPSEMLAKLFQAGQEQMRNFGAPGAASPGTAGTGSDLATQWMAASKQFAELQQQYMQQMTSVWSAALGLPSQAASDNTQPKASDKRFADEAWSKDPRFDLVRRMYHAYSDYIQNAVDATPLDDRAKGQLRFAARQFVDAMSPANFFTTNPEAISLAMETGGASVGEGMKRFFDDLAKGRITTTDEKAFEVGKNLAVTPGQVVFENELIQLVQYAPTAPQVHERPFVMVPPCINKFYILDLQPENSFVRYALEQGHNVFLVSWRNVSEAQGQLTWDDYLTSGVMKAVEVALDISGADQVNALGFCVGGTLLSSAVAVMKAQGDDKVASLTLLTSMLDFSDAGEIGFLVDEQAVAAREASIGKGGLLQGKELGYVFSSLRANDLVWPYVVTSYLKGKGPPAFDLLYWNSDATNLPGPMFCWYVRHCYLQNDLSAGRTVQCGVPVDLADIDVPAYLYASREDHIVPWKTAYESTRLLSGETTFVLGASGHIAGVINPANKNKRNYWTDGPQGADAEQWLAAAQTVPGSWWPHWAAWLAKQAGEKVPAPKALGNRRFRPIEPAPGRYVKEKA
jgi:polyhydroxyalkanoate synthase